MNRDDYEDDDNVEDPQMMVFAQPGHQIAKFLWTDVAFVASRCLANVVDEVGTALGYVSNIVAGHANYRRFKDNEAQMRGSIEDDLAVLSGQEEA